MRFPQAVNIPTLTPCYNGASASDSRPTMPRRAKTFLLSVLVAASAISFAEQVNAYATETASREVAAAVMQSRLDTPRDYRSLNLRHMDAITRVAMCESSLRPDVEIIDTNGEWSRGILQFQDRTWDWMSAEAGVEGSPLEPDKAFRVAEWAFRNGYASHWTCARKLGLH